MSIARYAVLSFLVGVLMACGQTENGDWIDVPLADHTFYPQPENYQQAEFDIPVTADDALEFKLFMNEGDAIVYRWTVEMQVPALLTAEFHGHTERQGEEPGTVMFYKKHVQGYESGSLIAPFNGIHGWYLKNNSDEDIVVNLSVAGFFQHVE